MINLEASKYERQVLDKADSHYERYLKHMAPRRRLGCFCQGCRSKNCRSSANLSPFERLNNALHAAYKSYHDGELNAAQWKQSFVQNLKDEEVKDIARILGIDPSHLSAEGLQNLKNTFAEAYEITAFIVFSSLKPKTPFFTLHHNHDIQSR